MNSEDIQEVSDEALMNAFVAGDTFAFRRLFDRYSRNIYTYSRRRLPSDQDAEDITQLTFLHVHRARESFQPNTRLRPWLYTICLNSVREFHRRVARRPEWLTDQLEERLIAPGEAQAEVRSERRALVALVDELPPTLREVAITRALLDQDYSEISERTGVVIPTLRVRFHRATRALQSLARERDAS